MKQLRLRLPFALCLLFVFCLMPFIDKAAHIDDPLFLWSASHILQNPYDFYGFSVNWYGWKMPMHEVMQNPPLTSYYLALLQFVGLKNCMALHLGMLVPGLFCVLGIYRLSGLFCRKNWLATLMSMATPCFFISASTFMAEMPLLCLWVWSVYWYVAGEQEERTDKICAASMLAGVAVLVKYNALALVPLLLAYSLYKRRRFRPALFFLLIPVGVALAYHLGTVALYGHSLLFGAMQYSLITGSHLVAWSSRLFEGLAFLGGNLLVCLAVAPWIWGGRGLVRLGVLWGACAACIFLCGGFGKAELPVSGGLAWIFAIQAGLFIVAGVQVHAVAWNQYLRQKNAETLLLLLWITGQCVFAFFVNWCVTSRTLLPLVPAACILAVRAMEQVRSPLFSDAVKPVYAVLCALVLAGCVAFCDYRWANAERSAATRIAQEVENFPAQVWNAAHWGWEYYLQQLGIQPLDIHKTLVKRGDLLLLPMRMLKLPDPSGRKPSLVLLSFFASIEETSEPGCSWLSLHHEKQLSGYHSNVFGPLPFIFAPTQDHRFRIYAAKRDIQFH